MSNKMAPDLGKLDELAKVHALSYASPHHFTMSVNGLREVIAELQPPAGNKMALDARGEIRKDMPSSAYKLGDEFKPFHPSASHVSPEWRDGWNTCFIAAIAALQAEPQPMESAPKDGTRFLAWYPKHRLDADDNPTGEPIGGAWAISSNNGGMWDEPDFLSAAGAWFFDDWCFADEPTRWMPLPPDVDAALPATPPKD